MKFSRSEILLLMSVSGIDNGCGKTVSIRLLTQHVCIRKHA